MSQEFIANFYKFTVPKRSGGHRVILAPDESTKRVLRYMARLLGELTAMVCDLEVVHGFVPGRNPVTNAMRHVGRQYSVCLDIEDFFDHVTPQLVGPAMLHVAEELVMPEGVAAQGLPTSPALSNLAMIQFDALARSTLASCLARHGGANVVYTRYADDITISFDVRSRLSLREIRKRHVEAIRENVGKMLESLGMKINEKKVRLLHATGGRRRIITGISVGEHDIRIPRSFRRRLRAANHKCPGSLVTLGMREWSLLKHPQEWHSQVRDKAERVKELHQRLEQIRDRVMPLTVRVFAD